MGASYLLLVGKAKEITQGSCTQPIRCRNETRPLLVVYSFTRILSHARGSRSGSKGLVDARQPG